jgi:hypothetical protein
MITDKQIQKTIREACANGKDAIELKDGGERGSGRLAIIVKPRRCLKLIRVESAIKHLLSFQLMNEPG